MTFMGSKVAQLVHRQITGRRPEAPISSFGGAIRETYGSNRRGNPNARAAAADMGVSERTVRRWLKGEQKPSGDNAGKDTAAIQQAEQQRQARTASADYRGEAMPAGRAQRFAKTGMNISLGGDIQISNDRRNRSFGTFRLPPKAADKVAQAWMSGDETALKDALEAAVSDFHVGSDVEIHQLSSINISR